MSNPLVSIIIPARNSQDTLSKCLDSILNLNYKTYEIIVINDGSTDDTADLLKKYSGVSVLTTSGVGPSQARNLGIQHAKGEFVAFTDADCIVDTFWLDELLKGFKSEGVAATGGIQLSPEDETKFGQNVHRFFLKAGFITDYMHKAAKMREVGHNPSCNVMYRRSILEELGGFLVSLWPGEDVEIDYRIRKKGYKLIMNPQAKVFHYRPDSFNKFATMMFRYGSAQGILTKKYGLFRLLQWVPLVMFILGCLFLLLLFRVPLVALSLFGITLLAMCIYFSFNLIVLVLAAVGYIYWNAGYLKGFWLHGA